MERTLSQRTNVRVHSERGGIRDCYHLLLLLVTVEAEAGRVYTRRVVEMSNNASAC